MQFYLNGYRPGDPDILDASDSAAKRSSELPDAVDVLVVGSGPAASVLAAQLAMFPGIAARLIERRGGPLELGQADGVACRTVEMFEALGLGTKLVREAYWRSRVRQSIGAELRGDYANHAWAMLIAADAPGTDDQRRDTEVALADLLAQYLGNADLFGRRDRGSLVPTIVVRVAGACRKLAAVHRVKPGMTMTSSSYRRQRRMH